jgi:hypothetical protein
VWNSFSRQWSTGCYHPKCLFPLETTRVFEQVAIEVTASIAQHEQNPAQVYRFGLLEDFDHLYRYSALYDRMERPDPNNILQSYSDILPGRPTAEEHRGCIEQLGADPTVQTPSADISAVASQGTPKVLLDPRTSFPQCLEAVLTAELVDCDAWERLTELAEGFNQCDMAEKFRQAITTEHEHRMFIRQVLEHQMSEEGGWPGSAPRENDTGDLWFRQKAPRAYQVSL